MIVLGVPTLNRWDLCQKLLKSACAGTLVPDLLVVVDNGQQVQSSEALQSVESPDRNLGITSWRIQFGEEGEEARIVIVESPGRNLGVGASWNFLAKRYLTTPDDRLLVCGDDTLLSSDLVAQLVKTMDESGVDFVFPDPALSTMPQMFSCFMVRQSLFEKVGYFDERFWPAYFEDNDFHRRMKFAGATEAVAPCGYEHANSSTMKAYSPDDLERHHMRFRLCRDYYIEKWGGLPGHETFTVPFNKTA
jgi:GT2 family glycosyltransferase